MIVTLKYEWDMGHRLPHHEGKCRSLHGHHYVMEVDIAGQLKTEGSESGMVIDFGNVKYFVKALVDNHWDHHFMLWDDDQIFDSAHVTEEMEQEWGVVRVPFVPTAENIAKEIFRYIGSLLPVARVRVYETPNAWAETRGGD